jgi:DNA-binding transcriptional ArsR family regulator
MDLTSEAEFYEWALGDPIRLQIVTLLGEQEEMTSGEIVQAIGKPWSNVSQHLGKMREHGIVATRKQAQWVYFRLAKPEFARAIKAIRHAGQRALAGDLDGEED